jgi:hypothetical protein
MVSIADKGTPSAAAPVPYPAASDERVHKCVTPETIAPFADRSRAWRLRTLVLRQLPRMWLRAGAFGSTRPSGRGLTRQELRGLSRRRPGAPEVAFGMARADRRESPAARQNSAAGRASIVRWQARLHR